MKSHADPISPGARMWNPPRLAVLGRRWSSFQLCGATGLFLATSLVVFLATHAALSLAIAGGLLAMGAVTFLALAMATKIVTGRESLIYYHHEVAILVTSAAVLSALDLPVLPYLDLTALWLGVFLTCGRVGCLMVGCCHGRPHRWGVRYGDAHAAEGFPSCYVGVRLFPVQALESIVVAAIVIAGSVLFVQDGPAGTVLSTYVVTYSVARIGLEELRGDRARPYWGRFSEAQWTSLALIAGVVLAEWQGRLPFAEWHVALCIGAALSMLLLAAGSKPEHALVHPRHADEVAAIVRSPPATGGPIAVRRTSLTIGVSAQRLNAASGADTVLYSLSRVDHALTDREALTLARLIVNLRAKAAGRRDFLQGGHGVFHLVVGEPARGAGRPAGSRPGVLQ
jgi:prolipoprotein diacylglyceryltransferase